MLTKLVKLYGLQLGYVKSKASSLRYVEGFWLPSITSASRGASSSSGPPGYDFRVPDFFNLFVFDLLVWGSPGKPYEPGEPKKSKKKD